MILNNRDELSQITVPVWRLLIFIPPWVSPPVVGICKSTHAGLITVVDCGRTDPRHLECNNPNAIILAEHYGDPGEWLQGDEWDTIMNYDAFMEPITWFLTGMEKHSDEMRPELKGNADHFTGTMLHF